MMQTLLGVPEVAKTLRTNENKVLGLIRSGELPAINLAQSARPLPGLRPRKMWARICPCGSGDARQAPAAGAFSASLLWQMRPGCPVLAP
jgi:hypothetical protein